MITFVKHYLLLTIMKVEKTKKYMSNMNQIYIIWCHQYGFPEIIQNGTRKVFSTSSHGVIAGVIGFKSTCTHSSTKMLQNDLLVESKDTTVNNWGAEVRGTNSPLKH